jgi:hypothetical protein
MARLKLITVSRIGERLALIDKGGGSVDLQGDLISRFVRCGIRVNLRATSSLSQLGKVRRRTGSNGSFAISQESPGILRVGSIRLVSIHAAPCGVGPGATLVSESVGLHLVASLIGGTGGEGFGATSSALD